MEIPASFTTALANRFYTTEVSVVAITTTTDTEGGVKKSAGAVSQTIKANVQPVSAELRNALIGEQVEAEYKITAPTTISTDKGGLITFGSNTYEVIDCKKYDSHAELLAKRWVAP